LLGLAFKPETDDLRDAPAIEIAQQLIGMGARVRVYDPVAMPACQRQFPQLRVEYAESAILLARECDALVVVTEWEEFRQLDLQRMGAEMNTRILIDGRNVLDRNIVEAADFKYRGIGR
jgi:UDPglucose 6-dehydrogenase